VPVIPAPDKLNAGYIDSMRTSNVAWFEDNLAEDFLNTNPEGSLQERSGFIESIARPIAVKNLACEDVRIRVLGDFAIIHARTTYVKPDGKAGAGRYTDIYARRDGRWQAIAAQVTRG
jgi:ketosteroid isomerase-like protein